MSIIVVLFAIGQGRGNLSPCSVAARNDKLWISTIELIWLIKRQVSAALISFYAENNNADELQKCAEIQQHTLFVGLTIGLNGLPIKHLFSKQICSSPLQMWSTVGHVDKLHRHRCNSHRTPMVAIRRVACLPLGRRYSFRSCRNLPFPSPKSDPFPHPRCFRRPVPHWTLPDLMPVSFSNYSNSSSNNSPRRCTGPSWMAEMELWAFTIHTWRNTTMRVSWLADPIDVSFIMPPISIAQIMMISIPKNSIQRTSSCTSTRTKWTPGASRRCPPKSQSSMPCR